VPVPTDDGGVRPDLLAAAFAASGARLVYLQPGHANPSGATLAPDRHAAVLAAAAQAGAFVIEDDFARDLTLEGDPPPTLASADDAGRVIAVRSLSKSAAPGLRIAGVCARGPVAARLTAARVVEDLFVAGRCRRRRSSCSRTRDGRAISVRSARQLRGASRCGRRRRAGEAADGAARAGPARRHVSLGRAAGRDRRGGRRARGGERGVLVTAGRAWFPAEPEGPYLRLSYAAADSDTFRDGVERLAGVLRG
jgi:DNA-binding transcriptional MocR family regulator